MIPNFEEDAGTELHVNRRSVIIPAMILDHCWFLAIVLRDKKMFQDIGAVKYQ